MDSTHELEQQVKRLREELDEMRARLAGLEDGRGNAQKRSDRRGFLKLGAGAVLGAMGVAAGRVLPAAAATGGNMILGNPNQADANTSLTAITTDFNPVFTVASKGFSSVVGGPFNGPLQGLGDSSDTTGFDGVDGWAGGMKAFGVYGLTDSGVGVAGEASTGVSLYARGTGRIEQDGLVTPGTGQAPSFPGDAFEMVRDQDGVMWICDASGAWRRVNTPRADAAAGTGVAYKPFRIIDTRGSLGAFPGPHGTGSHSFPIAGQGTGAQTIPADAVAVFGNLTITNFSGSGWATIAPAGAGTDPVNDPSSVNWGPGMQPSIANSFFCGLGTGSPTVNGGKVTVFVERASGSNINYIVDITGYVQ